MALNLGPVQAHVRDSINLLAGMFGFKTVGGWRANDPYPDHPSGLAGDFMTNDIPNGKSIGDQLAAYVVANADALGVKYVIWYRQVWTREKGWHKYTGSSNPHTDHVHITWNATPGTGGLLTNVKNSLGTSLVDKTFDFDGFFKQAEGTVLTVAVAGVGLALLGAGVWMAVQPSVSKAIKSVPGIGSLT
jgi:hypothetical protein